MPHLVDHKKPVPFTCKDCIHVDPNNPLRCKAFDLIPIGISGEDHIKVVKGQKGSFVFQAKEEAERHYDNAYVVE